MMLRTITLVGALCGFAISVGAQNLDDIAVEKAIKAGQDNKFRQWTAECKASASLSEKRKDGAASWTSGSVHFTGPFNVTISTNSGRVALLAAEAKRQQKPLRAADVPDRFRGEGLHLLVDPIKPGGDWGGGVEVPAPIDRVVLRSKAEPTAVVQPAAFDTEDMTWAFDRVLIARYGPDGKQEINIFKKSRAMAVFPVEAIKSLPAGDFEILVSTAPVREVRSEAGERACPDPRERSTSLGVLTSPPNHRSRSIKRRVREIVE